MARPARTRRPCPILVMPHGLDMHPHRPYLRLALLTMLLSTAALHAQTAPRTRPAPKATPRPAVLPSLGDPVPAAILKARAASKTCDTGEGRHDPCATVPIHRERITIAWDAATARVTWLYSTTLTTDSDIAVGDEGRIDSDSPVTPYLVAAITHGFVTPDWADTVQDLSGSALWYAVMRPSRPHYGKIVGFVLSIYLYLPDFDPPLIYTASTGEPGEYPVTPPGRPQPYTPFAAQRTPPSSRPSR
jgi:hypothetical protein